MPKPPAPDPSPIKILENALDFEQWYRIRPGLWTTDEEQEAIKQQDERMKLIIESLNKMKTVDGNTN